MWWSIICIVKADYENSTKNLISKKQLMNILYT